MQLRLNSKHIIIRKNKSKSKPYSFPIPGSKIQLFHLSLVFLPVSNMLSHIAKNQLMNTLRKNICLLMYLSRRVLIFPGFLKSETAYFLGRILKRYECILSKRTASRQIKLPESYTNIDIGF